MFEVLVIENAPAYCKDGPPLATWTEIFCSYEEALAYKENVIMDEPLSYNRAAVTTLITNLEVEKRAPLMEVMP
jgi:hypothetical protein